MVVFFLSAFLGTLIFSFILGHEYPNGLRGLFSLFVLFFFVRGLNDFLLFLFKLIRDKKLTQSNRNG